MDELADLFVEYQKTFNKRIDEIGKWANKVESKYTASQKKIVNRCSTVILLLMVYTFFAIVITAFSSPFYVLLLFLPFLVYTFLYFDVLICLHNMTYLKRRWRSLYLNSNRNNKLSREFYNKLYAYNIFNYLRIAFLDTPLNEFAVNLTKDKIMVTVGDGDIFIKSELDLGKIEQERSRILNLYYEKLNS